MSNDIQALSRQANNEIRAAERNMFNGKNNEALEILEKAEEIIEQIKNEDPNFNLLKSLVQKSERLRKQIETKLGKTATTSSTKPTNTAPKTTTPPKTTTTNTNKPSQTVNQEAKKEATSDKLPGGVTKRIKDIDGVLKRGIVDRANSIFSEIEKMFGSQISMDHPEIVGVKNRIAEVEEQKKQEQLKLEKEKQAHAENENFMAEWIDKLYIYIDRNSDKYFVDTFDARDLSDEDKTKRESIYNDTVKLMAEYNKVEFPGGKSIQLENIEKDLIDRIKQFEEEKQGSEIEEGSKEWVTKLNVFNARNSEKCIFYGVTMQVDELVIKKKSYDEALAVFEEYKKVDFPQGKSGDLTREEEELEKNLNEFMDIFNTSIDKLVEDVKNAMNWPSECVTKEDWKNDDSKKPTLLRQKDFNPIEEKLNGLENLLQSDDSRLVELNNSLADIKTKNEDLRKISAQRTFILDDIYKSGDAQDIKKFSITISGPVLKQAIIKDNWKEETVEEWTDTTKTAVRKRTTKSISVQCIVEAEDNEFLHLHTLHVAQDKNQDGSWGKLYGHIMFTDEMAKQNA